MLYNLTSIINEDTPQETHSNENDEPGTRLKASDKLPTPVFTGELGDEAFKDLELFHKYYESKFEGNFGARSRNTAAETFSGAGASKAECSRQFLLYYGESLKRLFDSANIDFLIRKTTDSTESPCLLFSETNKKGLVFVDISDLEFSKFLSNKKVPFNSEFESIIKGVYTKFINLETTRGIVSNGGTTLFLEIDETKLDELLQVGCHSNPEDFVVPFRYKVIRLDEDFTTMGGLIAWIYRAISKSETSRLEEKKVVDKFNKLVQLKPPHFSEITKYIEDKCKQIPGTDAKIAATHIIGEGETMKMFDYVQDQSFKMEKLYYYGSFTLDLKFRKLFAYYTLTSHVEGGQKLFFGETIINGCRQMKNLAKLGVQLKIHGHSFAIVNGIPVFLDITSVNDRILEYDCSEDMKIFMKNFNLLEKDMEDFKKEI
ncbi:hypothetical protein HYPBUDRAFT_146256 [Hyphopichia burtonii NRRL Y-1933]|uniref:Uncharacterized protein n=1 Tax=Hyphopichia burtonii NRRL Y-1933 TaxID=984485 RepID=A0A1E4RRJ0_9ASCO|nr:hypothetical protein HYPBUDRAFT_146256 [Hyphopichia burtonii NRRL Y-1933]ODV69868.1 hypothetical protein HYPBUDRAFT_146256 [Hyphopichia burtonii NRRL Y-1933]